MSSVWCLLCCASRVPSGAIVGGRDAHRGWDRPLSMKESIGDARAVDARFTHRKAHRHFHQLSSLVGRSKTDPTSVLTDPSCNTLFFSHHFNRHYAYPPEKHPPTRHRHRTHRHRHRYIMSPTLPAVKELGPNHVCLDQSDANVQLIAKSLPWYGPKHSPHTSSLSVSRKILLALYCIVRVPCWRILL